ncbi:MAG TPA: glycosyltransferase family 2 protein [Candidatus Nanoarchaeia archaeon]|nr:glycosyltransferase family 2 protein [Candidatus Nanoarchaeia archaeon]
MNNIALIPAYNEEKTIAGVVTKTRSHVEHVVVIDDGSADATSSEAERAGAIVLIHKVNLGKGAALKTGCEYALQQGAQKIVVLDADGQHDPKEIPRFMEALKQNEVVFGYRQVPDTMPFMMRFGNSFINRALRVIYSVNIQDSQCGYRAFTAAAYPQIRWDAVDYYVETEMILRVGKKKLKHAVIPIETIYADKYKGTTVLDGVKIVTKMIGGRLW